LTERVGGKKYCKVENLDTMKIDERERTTGYNKPESPVCNEELVVSRL